MKHVTKVTYVVCSGVNYFDGYHKQLFMTSNIFDYIMKRKSINMSSDKNLDGYYQIIW